jgi:hypothetical protein
MSAQTTLTSQQILDVKRYWELRFKRNQNALANSTNSEQGLADTAEFVGLKSNYDAAILICKNLFGTVHSEALAGGNPTQDKTDNRDNSASLINSFAANGIDIQELANNFPFDPPFFQYRP